METLQAKMAFSLAEAKRALASLPASAPTAAVPAKTRSSMTTTPGCTVATTLSSPNAVKRVKVKATSLTTDEVAHVDEVRARVKKLYTTNAVLRRGLRGSGPPDLITVALDNGREVDVPLNG